MVDRSITELEARLQATSVPPVEPLERINALNELAWELRLSEQFRANTLASEARDLALEHGYTLGQARAARTMAMTFRATEGWKTIFDLAQEAMRLFDEVNDKPGRAASRDFLASLYEFIGDLGGGLELALDALSIARDLGDPIRQGYALSSIGGILAASGEVDASVERLTEALELFESVQDLGGVGAICSRLCKVLKGAGRNDEALTYAHICRNVAEETQNEYLHWAALTVMAQIEEEHGQVEQAEQSYRTALDCLSADSARNMVGVETQLALGRLLMKQGSLGAAEVELLDALARIEDRPMSIVNEAAAHEALAELRQLQAELPATIEHLRKAQALREQIAQRDARNKLAQVDLRVAMEGAKKDAEIHKLRFVELHAMQAKLVEAEKMALLGKLAAGTAHELNTPLGVLRSNTMLASRAIERLLSLIGEHGELGLKTKKIASVMESCKETNEEAVERIAAIAENFRRFTQVDQAERGGFDVREGLDSALALLEPTLPDQIRVVRRFGEVPAIDGWPRELNHAFMTVLQNAAQAISGAGEVSVETLVVADSLLVRIVDTGRGMNEEQLARLFDVSWSEDGTRTQMRLGLSATYTTVQKHGGTIEVQSAPGQGTTVTFRFPIPRTG